jgi:hypothetical protein
LAEVGEVRFVVFASLMGRLESSLLEKAISVLLMVDIMNGNQFRDFLVAAELHE